LLHVVKAGSVAPIIQIHPLSYTVKCCRGS
jgi:hypothetical protein